MNNIDKMLNTNNWFSFKDFYRYIATIEGYKTYVELGVWKGHSISFLADRLRSNTDCKIYAVDIFEKWDKNKDVLHEVKHIVEIYNQNLKNVNVRHLITDIESLSWAAAVQFEDKSVDFLFIDADHTYDSVVKDINTWLPKMKEGSIISGHDYFTAEGVKRAVDEILGDVKSIKKENIWYKKL